MDLIARGLAQTSTTKLAVLAQSSTEWINAKQPPFNAKSNGIDNDQIAIQQVIDFCEANKKAVYIPDGDYLLNSPIRLGSNATLIMGENTNLIRNFTAGGTSGATIQNKTTTGAGNTNITIMNGVFKVNDSSKVGKHFGFWNVDGLQILGTKIRGCYSDWMTIFRKCTNTILHGLDFDAVGETLYTDGIHFCGGSKISISDCIVTSVDDALAFTMENSNDTSISDVTVTNCVLTTKRASVIKIMLGQPAWKASTAYAVGNQVIANSKIYKCTVAGTSSTAAPSHTTGTATDGTVTWTYVSTTTRTDFPVDGTTISKINITNIVGKGGTLGEGQAIWLDDRTGMKRIKDITLGNVSIDCSQGAGYGMQITQVEGLYTDTVKLYQTDGTSVLIDDSKDIFLNRMKIKSPRATFANGIVIRNTDYFEITKPVIDFDVASNTSSGINIGAASLPTRYGKITGHLVRGAGGTGVRLINADGVDVLAGKVADSVHGIIEDTGSDNNSIKGNDVRGNTGTLISRTGTNTVVRENKGFTTENRGTFQLNSTATSVNVSHSLAIAPSSSGIDIRFRGDRGAVTKWWTSNITATSFTFNVDVAPGAIIDLSYEANAPRNI